jgi:hypothetical protein
MNNVNLIYHSLLNIQKAERSREIENDVSLKFTTKFQKEKMWMDRHILIIMHSFMHFVQKMHKTGYVYAWHISLLVQTLKRSRDVFCR